MFFTYINEIKKYISAVGNKLINCAGDEDWRFHKEFFKSVDQFLTDDGVICFIENRRPGYFNKNLFKEMVERLSPNLKLYESIWIPGTGWYLILICKNRRI